MNLFKKITKFFKRPKFKVNEQVRIPTVVWFSPIITRITHIAKSDNNFLYTVEDGNKYFENELCKYNLEGDL